MIRGSTLQTNIRDLLSDHQIIFLIKKTNSGSKDVFALIIY